MLRLRKNTRMAGLPPGTLIPLDEDQKEQVTITQVVYDEVNCEVTELESIEDGFPLTTKPAVTWINLDGVHDIHILEQLGDLLGIHIMVLEDILNTEERPRLEVFNEYSFFTLKALNYDKDDERLEVEQISILLGQNYVITFEEKPDTVFSRIRSRIINNEGRVRDMGEGYLTYILLDSVVDNYFFILERMGEKTELLEEALINNPVPETLRAIHNLKRDLIIFRRAIWPLREVIGNLGRAKTPLIGADIDVFLRDLYAHTIHIIDTVETFRDMISGMLDIYLSSVSNRMNEVMKVLTIIATIFIPLTLVTGIYGMNFQYMPELAWRWGYLMVWIILLFVSGVMLLYFKRKKWI